MKYKQRNRILALILSLTLLVGLFPATTAVAAEPPVEGVPTSMRLQRAFVAQGISSYFQTDDNHYASFYESPVTLGYDCYSPLQWMLLSFALINNQNVSLTLWELDESYPSFDENPIVLEPDLTNADAIEPFLKGDSPIGYLRGIRITDNVAEGDSEGYYTHVEMTPTEINEACVRALLDVESGESTEYEYTDMHDVYVYGTSGEPYIPPATNEIDSIMDEGFFDIEVPAVMPMDDAIQNYLLWDGTVVDESGLLSP